MEGILLGQGRDNTFCAYAVVCMYVFERCRILTYSVLAQTISIVIQINAISMQYISLSV